MDRIVTTPSLLWVTLGCVIGNFAYAAGHSGAWDVACERSVFQVLAIALAWVLAGRPLPPTSKGS